MAPYDMPRILLIDIETSPNKTYTWGLFKQNIALNQIEEPGRTICWSARWVGEKDVLFKSVHEHGVLEMVQGAWALLDQADIVVHYNGVSFDVPTLNKEFLYANIGPPASYQQIDLYRVIRRNFRLASYKLDFVCPFLGIGAKLNHKGMELWRDCMAGDNKAWRVMERYNKQDVKLTGMLYKRLLPWISNHPSVTVYDDTRDTIACPTCGSSSIQKRGFKYTKVLRYQRYYCNACGSWSQSRSSSVPADQRRTILKPV